MVRFQEPLFLGQIKVTEAQHKEEKANADFRASREDFRASRQIVSLKKALFISVEAPDKLGNRISKV